jgi:hypothetical protein
MRPISTCFLAGARQAHEGCVVAAAKPAKVVADRIQVVHRRNLLRK